jgi:membrane fusion protein, copper/silver efflux system
MTPAKLIASIIFAAGIFFAGYMANRQGIPAASSASAGQTETYVCPMHPQYTSDRPGECPICGMRLEPLSTHRGTGGSAAAESDPTGTGRIGAANQQLIGVRTDEGAANQQLIGVRTDEVRRAPASQLLRVPGRIAVDDSRLYRIVAAADGWVRELGPNTAGSFVQKDRLLASYYTNGLLASAQTLIFAMATNEQTVQGYLGSRTPSSLSLQGAVDSLRNLGMSERQIEDLKRTRQSTSQIDIYSPIDGFVLVRNLSPEQRFDKGTELYRIADIGHVWVLTDIFEKDREFLKPGARATVEYQGREFQARMSDSLPQFDPQSRTLKTRFELENPGFVLRPDMFVDVDLHVDMPEAMTVPADSVIDLGRRKTVYVAGENGTFAPRIVRTGWRLGERVQITGGLEPGERVVVSGNFLVDSESRMNLASAGAMPPAEKPSAVKDPVCGMDVDPKASGTLKSQWEGRTYFFCSEKCKKDFEANPRKYVSENMAAQDATGSRSAE